MKKLLWVGDAVVATGFARATHKTLETLHETWDVTVLGIGYNGDPHSSPSPYPIYPAFVGGDAFGVGRIADMVRTFSPDVVVLLNDPWNIKVFVDEIRRVSPTVPVIAWLAVDGRNIPRIPDLNELSLCVFWTSFAEEEAKRCGLTVPSKVVPLGVDLEIYYPQDQQAARGTLDFGKSAVDLSDVFIVGNIARNQPRKRLDLTIAYFAEWVSTYDVPNARLFLHVSPTGEKGCDIRQLVAYYGIKNRLILAEPNMGHGVPEFALAQTMATFDVMLSTTQGEGFGLPVLEGMACGIPQIVPDWSALGDWPGDAALRVPCTSTAVTPFGVNVIGGIADREATILALDSLYRLPDQREELRLRGLTKAAEPQLRWENIGIAFDDVLTFVLANSSKQTTIVQQESVSV